MTSKINQISTSQLREVVQKSETYKEVITLLGFEETGWLYESTKMRCEKDCIDTSHFLGSNHNKGGKTKPVIEYLHNNYTNRIDGRFLKNKLINEGYKKDICEICSQLPIWRGKELILQLDHINGDPTDNRLENLRILCPNCHTQTFTYASKTKHDDDIKSVFCSSCKKNKINMRKKNGICLSCAIIDRRIVQRPSYEQLLKDIEALGYVGTGKKYNVSDNAIRKWVKSYKKVNKNQFLLYHSKSNQRKI